MRIVDRKEFLKIDNEVLYRVIDSSFFKENKDYIYGHLPQGQPYIKYKNLSDDWFYYDLMEDIRIKGEQNPDDSSDYFTVIDKIKKNNPKLELDEICGQRDGAYEEDDKYLIYEDEDIKTIIERLQQTILLK